MDHSQRGKSSRILGTLGGGAVVVALALAAPACSAGYVDSEGYDADYAPAPPGLAAYPSYAYRGTTVYDADGRFYAQRDGRWVRYRHAPPEIERWHRDRNERGRAEWQR